MQRELRTRDMETKNAAFTITDEYMPAPTDLLEVRDFMLQTSPRGSIKYLPNELMDDYFDSSGIPKYYCPVGSMFRFASPPSGTYIATLIYFAKFQPLTSSNVQNWLLTQHPDIYLWGALSAAEAFLRDDARVPMWKAGYDKAIADIRGQSDRMRWGGQSMAVRAA